MSEQLEASQEGLALESVQPIPGLRSSRCLRRWQVMSSCALLILVLFAAYIRLSWTAPINSDGAANIFQALDILHGNLLLHGWWLSDASFYATELPQYVMLEALLGHVPAVIHVAAAMTYTLAVVLAAIVAKGRTTGREAVLRVMITAGIMLAPQPGGGVKLGGGAFVLDLSLGHIGTSVPLLITMLVLDRAGRRRWVPPVVGLLLAWVLTADNLVLYVGVIPVVAVCGLRAYRELVIERRSATVAWFEISLASSAVAAKAVSMSVLAIMHAVGGFTVYPDHPVLATGKILLSNLAVMFESILTLFGADFLGQPVGFSPGEAIVHLVGLCLACWAVWLGLRRLARQSGPGGLADEIMAVAVITNLLAFGFSTLAIDPSYAREIAVVLPFSAVLAGRLLATRLASARLLPALAAVLLLYIAGLGFGVAQPIVPVQNQRLAGWLAQHHLRYGLGEYWEATSITLASGQQVQVRPIDAAPGWKTGAYPWESEASWFDSARHDANFVILDPGRVPYTKYRTYRRVRRTFGPPVQTYHVGRYLVLVWDKNLLEGLKCGDIYNHPTGLTPSKEAPACLLPSDPCWASFGGRLA